MTGALLPEGFAPLEPFVADWALGTTQERDTRRSESTFEQLERFYAAAKPLLAPALAHLDLFPVKRLAAGEQRLMDLVLSLAHVAMAVEVHKDMEARHAQQRRTMRITRSSTDPA